MGGPQPRRRPPWRHRLVCLVAMVVLAGVSLYAFFSGFFLTRVELGIVAECGDGAVHNAMATAPTGRCQPATFRRLVLLVIDAWRYDFADPAAPHDRQPYHGQMPRLKRLLQGDSGGAPAFAHLYRFVADAPTVTQQRLKGLLTGSLPTFIDVSSSFVSGVLREDNVLAHLARANEGGMYGPPGSTIFIGDDTWMGLFPPAMEHAVAPPAASGNGSGGWAGGGDIPAFTVAFPFPSFNVRDLHTVDAGVIKHLPAAMAGAHGPWRYVVGHMLGVDHVGHRHTPNHAAMAAKLAQMDDFIATVVGQLEEDTLLAVLGDHGMTGDGNHGGGSAEEVDAALLLVTRRPGVLLPAQPGDHRHGGSVEVDDGAPGVHHGTRVSQLDLAATVAVLFGLPIPFASLGTIMPNVVPLGPPDPTQPPPSGRQLSLLRQLDGLVSNVQQVAAYSAAYHQRVPASSHAQLHALHTRAAAVHASLLEVLPHVPMAACAQLLYGVAPATSPPPHLRHPHPTPDDVDGGGGPHAATYDAVRCGIRTALRQGGLSALPTDGVSVIRASVEGYHTILADMAHVFRQLWTEFNLPVMIAGVVGLILSLVALIAIGGSVNGEGKGAHVANTTAQPNGDGGGHGETMSRNGVAEAGAQESGGADDGATPAKPATPGPRQANGDATVATTSNAGVGPVPMEGVPRRRVGGGGKWQGADGSMLVAHAPSPSAPVPASWRVSWWNAVGLALLVMRADGLFTDTLIVAEAPFIAVLLIAYVLLWSGAVRRTLSTPSARWQVVAYAAVMVTCVAVTVQRWGVAWPFPAARVINPADADALAATQGGGDATGTGSGDPRVETGVGDSSIGWTLDAGAVLPTHFVLGCTVFAVLPLLVEGWYRAVLRQPPSPAAWFTLVHVTVVVHWVSAQQGWCEGDSLLAVVLRLSVPRAVYTLALLAVAIWGVLRLVDPHGHTMWPLHAMAGLGTRNPLQSATLWTALPAMALVLGPGSALPLTAAVVFLAAASEVIHLQWLGMEVCPDVYTPAPPHWPMWKATLHSMIGDEVWFPWMTASFASVHWYFATGHGNQFNTIHFGAPFVGFDVDHVVVGMAAIALNTFGAHALVGMGMHRVLMLASAGGVGRHHHGRVGTVSPAVAAARGLILPTLSLACCCAFCAIARRHLMVWAIFAPKFVFEAILWLGTLAQTGIALLRAVADAHQAAAG